MLDVTDALRDVRIERLKKQTGLRIKPPRPCDKEDWPPDYDLVFAWRNWQLAMFELHPKFLKSAKVYYATHPKEFITHWCDTYDPRNAGTGKLTKMPLIPFPRQVDLINFLYECLKDQAAGLIEKSRDMGATWVGLSFSVWLWLFWDGAAIGWGSRKQELVDRIGDPSSIFEKMRMQILALPKVFLPVGFNERDHLSFMKCINPETGATITGEIGDNIGRGGRTLMYFKDESAHYEHPEKIEAALSDTTRVPIDISSVSGPGTVFHRKRENGIDWYPGLKVERGKVRVLVMDWRDHPEKSETWYAERHKTFEETGLLHILAQEVDRNYAASLQGTVIPMEWIDAAVDAHLKLNIGATGAWCAALDVADGGGDRNALTKRHGIILRYAAEWGARDPGVTARKAITECTPHVPMELQYDAIGVGAAIKAEANRLKEEALLPAGLELIPWNAGAKVLYPNARVVPDDKQSPKNKDFYRNIKAQGWWELRNRFLRTFQAVTQDIEHDPDTLISIDSKLPLLHKVKKELSQVTADKDSRLKLVIDKTPEGTVSPNIGDAIMMNYWPIPMRQFVLGRVGRLFQNGQDYTPPLPKREEETANG